MWSYDASIERLAYVSGFRDNDLILVCPGERDPVVCLAAADGKVCWRIPAIWEYERGFIGPSVFEHYIERFGLDSIVVYAAKSPVLPDDEEEIDREQLRETVRGKIKSQHKLNAAREAFDARYQGCITAGPIVVPDADGHGNPRAYVAAVRSLKPDDGSVQQPEHALLFEIGLNGSDMEFTAMTRLPRAVIGRPYWSVPGGLVLSCDRGSLVRLRCYEPDYSGGFFGPGATANDMILQIDWYREYLMRCPSAWFIANPHTDVAGFSETRLFRSSLAYVREKEDKVYELLINVVDLRSGLDRDLTLSVPFEGDLPVPETGLGSFNRGMPSERLHSNDPHAVWINCLSVDGDRLTVVVAHGPDFTALTFDLTSNTYR
jgi:hypothetical protein